MEFKEIVRHVRSVHIKKAVEEIDRRGVPKARRSRAWCLRIGKKRYPPKYVLSLAVKYALGEQLSAVGHPGGERTHGPLRKALSNEPRFRIIRCQAGSNIGLTD
jgi:hypothetical protein